LSLAELTFVPMRVEVAQELAEDDDKLEMPWASGQESVRRYMDLRVAPERIEALEECRQYPPLAGLLRKINAPASILQTAKCDVWTATELSEDERWDFKLPFKVGSYVDVVFARRELNSRLEPYLELGEALSERLRALRVQAQMEIAVRHCLFHPEERWGYSMTIFLHAYGESCVEAGREWERAVEGLGEALADFHLNLRRPATGAPGTSSS